MFPHLLHISGIHIDIETMERLPALNSHSNRTTMDNLQDSEDRSPVESEEKPGSSVVLTNTDEFGGPRERQILERRLLWKLDCRMFILVVIYILNYASAL